MTNAASAVPALHLALRYSDGPGAKEAWITELRNALNGGLLPRGFYAQGKQHVGQIQTDVLTLHASNIAPINGGGGVFIVTETPPRVSRKVAMSEAAAARANRRTLA